MAMTASLLSNNLSLYVVNADTELLAINNLATAWTEYFKFATAGAVPIIGPFLDTTPKLAMQAAMIGISQAGAGANSLQLGITAFWSALSASPVLVFPLCTLITPPPTLSTISSLLLPVFTANVQLELTATECYDNIANVLNGINIAGGIATITVGGIPTPLPIL